MFKATRRAIRPSGAAGPRLPARRPARSVLSFGSPRDAMAAVLLSTRAPCCWPCTSPPGVGFRLGTSGSCVPSGGGLPGPQVPRAASLLPGCLRPAQRPLWPWPVGGGGPRAEQQQAGYHCTPAGTAGIKTGENDRCRRGCGEAGTHTRLVGRELVRPRWPQRRSPCAAAPAAPLSRVSSKERQAGVHTKACAGSVAIRSPKRRKGPASVTG